MNKFYRSIDPSKVAMDRYGCMMVSVSIYPMDILSKSIKLLYSSGWMLDILFFGEVPKKGQVYCEDTVFFEMLREIKHQP